MLCPQGQAVQCMWSGCREAQGGRAAFFFGGGGAGDPELLEALEAPNKFFGPN